MFTENLAVFFNTSDFALAATYDGSIAVKVMFDNPYIAALGVSSVNPVALGKASDFTTAAVGRTLLISGTTYTIRDRKPQDDGALVLLELKA